MCTHCDRTCVKERFPSIYSLAQADLAQLVEHNLAKVGVAGSSPVVRSSESSSAVSPGEAALFNMREPLSIDMLKSGRVKFKTDPISFC